MAGKKLLLINFISGGGIKQFTNYLLKQLADSGVEFEYKETRSIKELLSLCRRHEDVVFCVNNIRIYILFLLLRNFSPILILHDHKARVGANKVERLLIACVHVFSKRFRQIIIHSEDAKLSGKKNVVVTRMPFHAPDFSFNDKVRVLYFGRIEPYKNLPYLVDIALRTQASTEYFIAGSGEIAPELKSRMNRASNISLINAYIDEKTIRLLFDWCDYLVLPYADITQTGLVDQAGYFAKPVVMSNIEGFRPYWDKGFCVRLDLNDLESAARQMAALPARDDAEYRKMVECSKQNYQSSADAWSEYVKVILENNSI